MDPHGVAIESCHYPEKEMMQCADCKTIIKVRDGAWRLQNVQLCSECFVEQMEQSHQVDFRFGDIEASLQYIPTAKKPDLEQQEREMR